MVNKQQKDAFLALVRLGVGFECSLPIVTLEWPSLQGIAEQQGLSAIVLDGVENLPEQSRPPKEFLLQWIGEVLQEEQRYQLHQEVATDMAKLFYRNAIKTYVLKGAVVSECYPKPNHRVSADVDCYLLPEGGDFDAWSLGNDLIRTKGFHINKDFYKNSSFDISGVNIENHQFFTPFRGNKRLAEFEIVIQALMKKNNEDVIEGTHLYRPPVIVTALFLVEHAYSHFLHEGLTWRHVLDWMMFSKKHQKEILWADFEALLDEYGFGLFYKSYLKLGRYLLGEIDETDLDKSDKRMLKDVWDSLDLHETTEGWRGKLYLAGNTWRARWKYRYFTDISWIRALWIQAKGFLFEKNPTLN